MATHVFEPGPFSVTSRKVDTSSAISPLTPYLFVVSPTKARTYPVLQFHHGFLCQCTFYSQLLEHIASHGFIIVAPQKLYIGQPGTEQIKELAAVTNWLATGLPPYLPDNVFADFPKFALAGHSIGGKEAFCLALGVAGITLNLKVSALIGIDPVAGVSREHRTEPEILTYREQSFNLGIPVGVIGSGLGCEKKEFFTPACAPDKVNHAEFFKECKPPCCYFVAKNYGHMDMLDAEFAGVAGCMCKSGTDPKELMRKGTGGIVVAFMKAYLESDNDDLRAIVNDPKIARIKLDPVKYFPE